MCNSVHCLRSALVSVIIYIYHLRVKAVGNMDSHYQIRVKKFLDVLLMYIYIYFYNGRNTVPPQLNIK